MKVITVGNRPIKMWLDDIEDGAMKQVENLAKLPFIYKWVAIMPDSHQGYGMPIGGVIATKGVVIPNAVGVDIGCGMCAVRTSIGHIDDEQLLAIVQMIKDTVPTGFNHQDREQDSNLMPKREEDMMRGPNFEETIVEQEYKSALFQLGTLGGGNHFIEIQRGDDGYIWIMIHSGSRNLGKKVADHYNKVAKRMNECRYSSVEANMDLAFLPIHGDIGKSYIREMNYCVEFALANRKLIMERIKEAFEYVIHGIMFSDMINIAHNYARMENHFGENVMVHRKGATSAKLGERGIIPGSQGTSSYIVRGLGNPDSFMSCSHGAGRKMGRREAQKNLNLQDEIDILNNQGIIHNITSIQDLDEASGAYKDIDVVMENQKDLVEIVVKLQPLAVIKG